MGDVVELAAGIEFGKQGSTLEVRKEAKALVVSDKRAGVKVELEVIACSKRKDSRARRMIYKNMKVSYCLRFRAAMTLDSPCHLCPLYSSRN